MGETDRNEHYCRARKGCQASGATQGQGDHRARKFAMMTQPSYLDLLFPSAFINIDHLGLATKSRFNAKIRFTKKSLVITP